VVGAHAVLARAIRTLVQHLALHSPGTGPAELAEVIGDVGAQAEDYTITPECRGFVELLASAAATPACQFLMSYMHGCLTSLRGVMPLLISKVHATQCASSVKPILARQLWRFDTLGIAGFGERRLVLGKLLQKLLDDEQAMLTLTALGSEQQPQAGVKAACAEPGELRMAEIGVESGQTSLALLQRFPSMQVLLVDPYEEGMRTLMEAMDLLKPYSLRATFMVQRSRQAACHVATGSLDLVFIDGDHSYEAVKEDILHWLPTLRSGGVLAGHDYSGLDLGTVSAVNEFVVEHGLLLHLGFDLTWWVIVP